MLRARELILQFRHLFLRAIEDAAKFICQSQIDRGAVDFRASLQLRMQTVAQLVRIDSNFLKERSRYSIRLIEKSKKEMLIGNFLVIGLRGEILRRLQRLLHLLRELIDTHESPSAIAPRASNALLGKESCEQTCTGSLQLQRSPSISLGDERGRKMDRTQSAGAFATGRLPA